MEIKISQLLSVKFRVKAEWHQIAFYLIDFSWNLCYLGGEVPLQITWLGTGLP